MSLRRRPIAQAMKRQVSGTEVGPTAVDSTSSSTSSSTTSSSSSSLSTVSSLSTSRSTVSSSFTPSAIVSATAPPSSSTSPSASAPSSTNASPSSTPSSSSTSPSSTPVSTSSSSFSSSSSTTSSSSSTTTTSSSSTTTTSSSSTTTTTTTSSSSSSTTTSSSPTTTTPISSSPTTDQQPTSTPPVVGTSSPNGGGGGSSTTNQSGPTTPTHSALTLSTPTFSPTPSPTSSTTSSASSTPGHLQSTNPPITSSQKRGIIAGSAAGFVLACLLLLGAVFVYRRRKKSQYEFLNALAAPTQRIHSRAMLLAGEDMDDDRDARDIGRRSHISGGGGGGGGGGESIGMRSLGGRSGLNLGLGGIGGGAGGDSPYQDLTFPAPATPWESGSGDPRSSMEALHHPSRAPPSPATQYMAQYLQRAGRAASDNGSVFREQLGDADGEGEGNRDGQERAVGEGTHSRNVSGASQDPLIPAHPPPYSPTAPAASASQAALGLGNAPARSSPLAGSAVRSTTSEDGQARTRNWIERTLAR